MLITSMRKREIRERLMEKVEEMLKKVKNRVKMRNRLKRGFLDGKGDKTGQAQYYSI